jgi:hypothetical protein
VVLDCYPTLKVKDKTGVKRHIGGQDSSRQLYWDIQGLAFGDAQLDLAHGAQAETSHGGGRSPSPSPCVTAS